jgi:2-keto-3-deoxy-L-rhamnonate aldolase RhmA
MSRVVGPRTEAFGTAVRAGTSMIGTTLFSASPAVTEVIAAAGFDFLIVDTEHTPLAVDSTVFQSIILSALLWDLPIVVRVSCDWGRAVQLALDSGAAGVMLSGVRTADEATRLVRAARYAPEGTRGACPVIRPTEYFGSWTAFRQSSLATPLVGVLIEDPVGVANIDEILATGVDIAWFGPFDYQVAVGVDSAPQAERDAVARSALKQISDAASVHGTAVAAVAWGADGTAQAVEDGATLLVMTSDLLLFGDGCRELLDRARSAIVSQRPDPDRR